MDLKAAYKTIMDDHFTPRMEISFIDGDVRQTLAYEKVSWVIDGEEKGLRYGENPGQEAAVYKLVNGNLALGDVRSIDSNEILASSPELLQSGKHPGKTNLTDADNALNILRYLCDSPCAVIVKHNNPCGVAKGATLAEAYNRANRADRLAAFGGCIALNREGDLDTARLICENYADGKVCILPMTFAQHPNYRTPLVCHFIFSPEWWLMGSEQLKLYPEAEVLITNELHCQNSNPAADRIFLRYFFGKEMIPYLRLECLKSRNVKILFNMTSNKLEMRNNLEETILLMARLKELDIKAEIMQINDDEPLNQEISDPGLPNVVFHYKPEKVGIEKIVTLGISYGIKIPENLKKYDIFSCFSKKTAYSYCIMKTLHIEHLRGVRSLDFEVPAYPGAFLLTGAKVYQGGKLKALDIAVENDRIIGVETGIEQTGFDAVFHVDGKVIVPEALRPYMGGAEIIG